MNIRLLQGAEIPFIWQIDRREVGEKNTTLPALPA
jgi:hypothetical protein